MAVVAPLPLLEVLAEAQPLCERAPLADGVAEPLATPVCDTAPDALVVELADTVTADDCEGVPEPERAAEEDAPAVADTHAVTEAVAPALGEGSTEEEAV